MTYHFTIQKTEQGYSMTRDDFLGYSAAVVPDDLGDTVSKMVELAPPANCLLEKLAYGIAAGLLREAGRLCRGRKFFIFSARLRPQFQLPEEHCADSNRSIRPLAQFFAKTSREHFINGSIMSACRMAGSFMRCSLFIGVCLLWNAMAAAQEKQTEAVGIPLDKIWGYNMPGTRDLQKVEGRLTAKQWEGIRRALSTPPPQGKEAALGFAVVGAGPDALREVHAVLAEGKKPRQTFPPDSDVSLVFFSYQFGFYVHLRSVAVRGNDIEIQYQFVPHKTKELTEHFALIPLGKLLPGKVQVEIVQSPMAQEFVSAGWKPISGDVARRIVCRPFSFVVK